MVLCECRTQREVHHPQEENPSALQIQDKQYLLNQLIMFDRPLGQTASHEFLMSQKRPQNNHALVFRVSNCQNDRPVPQLGFAMVDLDAGVGKQCLLHRSVHRRFGTHNQRFVLTKSKKCRHKGAERKAKWSLHPPCVSIRAHDISRNRVVRGDSIH